MENAAKGLLIAGALLLSILIVAIIVSLIVSLKKTTDTYGTKLDTVELQKYNSNYEVYINRKDITAQEIVSLVNISQQKEKQTKVYLDGIDCTNNWAESNKTSFLQNNILEEYEYVSITYDINSKVIQIKFKTK